MLRDGLNNNDDRYSEHGLGHLLNPADPQSDDRDWIAQAWLAIVRRSLGLPSKPLRFEKRVAVGRTTVSSPAVMKAAGNTQRRGKTYAKQIKPFNFILSCHVRKLGHPIGVEPERSTSSRRSRKTRGSGKRCSGSISTRRPASAIE